MRIKPLLTFLALTVILAVAACVPATPSIPRDDTGAGSGTPGSSQGSGDAIPQTGGQGAMEEQVRNQVSQFLTQQFNAASNSIESITLSDVDWPDSCLGMGGANESCAAVITPGWRVTARVNGQEYTLQQAAKFLENHDRSLRESVYRKINERRLQDKEALNDLYSSLVQKRHQMARNAGFDVSTFPAALITPYAS